jgi:hypothetical protein
MFSCSTSLLNFVRDGVIDTISGNANGPLCLLGRDVTNADGWDVMTGPILRSMTKDRSADAATINLIVHLCNLSFPRVRYATIYHHTRTVGRNRNGRRQKTEENGEEDVKQVCPFIN